MYLLPLLERLANERQPLPPSPEALAILPTPELVVQVSSIAERLAASLPEQITVARITGPQTVPSSFADARLIIATAEQVWQRTRDGTLSTAALRCVAIDEADALLCERAADGPEETLEDALRAHGRPQFLLATATLSDAHEEMLMRRFTQAQRVSHTGVLVPTLR